MIGNLCRLLCALALAAGSPGAEPRFLGACSVPPESRDHNNETIGAIGSGVTYDAKQNVYLFVSDRGPGDGEIDYRPRFDSARVELIKGKLTFELGDTTLLRAADGKFMTGLKPRGSENHPALPDGRWCIDPEAIAIAQDDSIYIADEYGPFLYQFHRDGTMIRCIKPPDHYLPKTDGGIVDFGERGAVVAGRIANRGFEGMALTPDGSKAVLILQSGLAQDGGKDSPATRILVIDLLSEAAIAEHDYQFASLDEINRPGKRPSPRHLKQDDLSVSELLAIDDHRFLVLERDNGGANGSLQPKPAIHKCIYLIDLAGATNRLSNKDETFRRPVRKTLVLDLLRTERNDPAMTNDKLAAKWEGLALTPPGADGQRRLLVTSDNDFLNPALFIDGRVVPFPRAKRPLATQLILYQLTLP